MGQFSVEISFSAGSVLGGIQQASIAFSEWGGRFASYSVTESTIQANGREVTLSDRIDLRKNAV